MCLPRCRRPSPRASTGSTRRPSARLSAAAVIGSRFEPGPADGAGHRTGLDDLLAAELIDQVRFTREPEYVFHHPLIRTVAYESQLKSDRAELHRRVAAAIEAGDPAAADENAALIAEHLEAAGDLHAAYGWHMRAATWATNRDIGAARLSWERALKIADALPDDDPDRAAMRIAPRTMLCGTAFRVDEHVAGDRFDELRELCTAAGDKASLAIAMAGLVMDHALSGPDARGVAAGIGSHGPHRVGRRSDLDGGAVHARRSTPSWRAPSGLTCCGGHRGSSTWPTVTPSKGNFIFGSPLAFAFATRAIARYCLGRPGWRDDLRHGLAMARSADPLSYAAVVSFVYFPGIPCGVLRPDDRAVREIEDALRIAERSGDDFALAFAQMTLGVALVHRHNGCGA